MQCAFPQGDGFPTLIPASQPVDTNGTRGDGMFCCFTHEGASTQGSGHAVLDGGLIWLRHACARMGHQIAASPMVRYIQHGGRNQSVAVNSLSWLGIGRHARYSSSTPPHPERERHSHVGVKSEGGRTKRLCCLLGGRAATLRGSKLAKGS